MSEELTAIMEAIKSLGSDGTRAFIWYIVVSEVGSMLRTIIVVGGIFGIFKIVGTAIYRAVKAHNG